MRSIHFKYDIYAFLLSFNNKFIFAICTHASKKDLFCSTDSLNLFNATA